MALSYIWAGFFLIAFIVATGRLLTGDASAFTDIVNQSFASAKMGFEISLGLTGVLCFWLGILRIGEKGGLVQALARWSAPLFSKLFPDIPKGHPVTGAIVLNFSANLLGLDNAATPVGLKAMQQLQELNCGDKDTATNSMIMFLCINASGLTLLPVTILMYRLQLGATNPADVFLPILLATSVATFVAIITVGWRQGMHLGWRSVITVSAVTGAVIAGLCLLLRYAGQEALSDYSTPAANVFLFAVICGFLVTGIRKKVNVYEAFTEGAKEGFGTAITIIPYLVAILIGIGIFRASGAMGFLTAGIRTAVAAFGCDTSFVEALPTILMKPLSGSGSRGLMIDAMTTFGADSFAGRLACIVQGSTDTTFYVLALYYGSVGIRRTRYTLSCALLADLAGTLAAIFIAYLFFPPTA
jgi:spore maturation protein SpmA